ncbi:MAG TPA: hypothetical protein VKY66_06320 [Protaetiibacter sp.]|nr:hypothetical protein [Protaetiibacter sp.]
MPLPLVPVVIGAATLLTGGAGGAVGVWGGAQLRRAKAAMATQAARYEHHYAVHLGNVAQTNTMLQVLGRSQHEAQQTVILRMKHFLERHAKQVRLHEQLILDGVDGGSERVAGLTRLETDLAGWVRGVVGSAVVGAAVPTAVRAGVAKFAVASTGTAIARLSGAAATNATLAWLGGGALAAGGGGMALGAIMLNVALVGPTVLMGGIAVKNQGTKATTAAERHRTETELAIAELTARDTFLRAVRVRVFEIDELLTRMIRDATAALDELESEAFHIDQHAEQLQRALILVKAVKDISTAPVFAGDDELHADTAALVLRYRTPSGDA